MPKSSREKYFKDLYFRQGNKRIDYILVYSTDIVLRSKDSKKKLGTFLDNLAKAQVEVEVAYFSGNNDIGFLKLHAPQALLIHYAEVYNIELACNNPELDFTDDISYFRFMRTDLSSPNLKSEAYERAKESVGRQKPTTLTQAERILIVDLILKKIPFGESYDERGIGRLLYYGIILAAYPLHEGPTTWSKKGPLTDRQLLANYWGNMKKWYKEQPLDLLERYFGSELAYYFNFLGFYNKMLFYASAASFFFFVIGCIHNESEIKQLREQICSSEKILCPRCHPSECAFNRLSDACLRFTLVYLLDNVWCFLLGIFITFWGTIFMELWGRRQQLYQLKWNLRSVETNITIRPGYEKRANAMKKSHITGEMEPYMTKTYTCVRYIVTSSTMLLLILIMVSAVVAVVWIKGLVRKLIRSSTSSPLLLHNVGTIEFGVGVTWTVVWMLLIDQIYHIVAMHLTKWQNPRTQIEFDNSYILKSYALAFVNNYASVFYIAFFKNKFYTYPGDPELYGNLAAFKTDLCDVAGCNMDLALQIFFILGIKHLAKCLYQVIYPIVLIQWKKLKTTKSVLKTEANYQWEKDYFLNEFETYDMVAEYIGIIIRYGHVLFFTSIFPFTPFFALICNIAELRVDAYKYTNSYRRPVANKVSGLEIWEKIMYAVTWMGVAMNALIVVFTKDIIYIYHYKYYVDPSLQGYYDTKFSSFSVEDYPIDVEVPDNQTVCYYHGFRYPYMHPRKYKINTSVYMTYVFAAVFVIVYEHIVVTLTRLVAFFIPDTSTFVAEQIYEQERMDKQLRRRMIPTRTVTTAPKDEGSISDHSSN